MSQPLVSVIVATRDRPEFLRRALASILSQTLRSIEVIVSDDAGTTGAADIVAAFSDQRIRYLRNDTCLGIAKNVSAAMRHAQGKYITNLHDDDLWAPTFLEELTAALDAHPDAVLAFSDYEIIDVNDHVDEDATVRHTAMESRTHLAAGMHKPFHRMGVELGSVFLAGAVVFRNGIVDWDEIEAVGVLWDRYCVYALARDGHGAVYVPRRLGRYRRHAETETMRSGSRDVEAKLRKAASGLICAERILADERVRDVHPWVRHWQAEHQTSKAIALLRMGSKEGVRSSALAGWQGCPCLRSAAAVVLARLPTPAARLLASIAPRSRGVATSRVATRSGMAS